MCGQLGYSGKDKFEVDKIKILMYVNAIERGMDSTGIYSPLNSLKKTLSSGRKFTTNGIVEIIPDNIFMGHVRAATVGDKSNVNNAHPFKRGNYILQHNGTLTNYWDLLDKYELDFSEYYVDSDVVCGAIEKSNSILNVLKEIDGPAAIIIADISNKNILYVFRNKERPLFKGYFNGNMYMSSTSESLRLINCNNVKEFKEDTLYCIKNGAILSANIIKNTPYKSPPKVIEKNSIVTNPYMIRNSIYKSVGCWIRANASWEYHFKGVSFKVVDNKYYYVNYIDSVEELNISDIDTGKSINISKSCLKIEEDSIYDEDYCITKMEIKNMISGELAVKEGVIVKIRDSFNDGECTIYDKTDTKFLCCTKKVYLVKLTPDELSEYLATNKPMIVNSAEKSAEAFLKALKQPDLFPDDEPSHDSTCDIITKNAPKLKEDDYYDLMLNNQDLAEHFTEFDDKLEGLLDLANKTECPEQVVKIIEKLRNLNYERFDKFTLPLEEAK